MRVHGSPIIRRIVASLMAAGIALSVQGVHAEVATAPAAHTTVEVFADRPVQDKMWARLFDAVRRSVAEEKIPELDSTADFVRGDRLILGRPMENVIVVFLQGDCRLRPMPGRIGYSVRLG